ncbi:MAG TPA: class I SAM-dependent methyltransferase [Patescibacteria group bacterium]|nr:class I SAM-dependent methyltransferase [Patescibacteria group bacterium]
MKSRTSWQPVAKWYNKLVSDKGHYYHQHVVIPGVLRLLSLDKSSRLLDVACGQGILGRSVPKGVSYTGFDIAGSLIAEAKRLDHDPNHTYIVGDATQALPLGDVKFTHAAMILALQNIEDGDAVITNISKYLLPSGKFVIVLNHPAFRIPRQSSWGIDEGNKLQYRRVNIYMSPLKIPIDMHPGKRRWSPARPQTPERSDGGRVTWSFHQPISYYAGILAKYGFVIDAMEEWTSDKESEGKASKMENRSRSEFPLFLAIGAIKLPV